MLVFSAPPVVTYSSRYLTTCSHIQRSTEKTVKTFFLSFVKGKASTSPKHFVNEDQANRVWLNDGTGQFLDSGQALGNAVSLGVALGDLDEGGTPAAFTWPTR